MSTDVLTRCAQCGTQLAPGMRACPACGRLFYAERLKSLAAEADRLKEAGDLAGALGAWREAVELLPPDSTQYAVVTDKIAELSRTVDKQPGVRAPEKPSWAGKAGLIGTIGLALWKFKFVLAFILTKGKLLLLGLTKGGTFFSMLLSFGFYLSLWGWKLAAGIVLSIYIHEMGHVAMLRHFGIPATAPMFIPGLGAFIRTKYYPKDVVADARVGLAGPIWGLGAALASHALFLFTHHPIWSVIAFYGALINLFNLIPVWQLDGAHGFRALTGKQRWWAVGAIGAAWLLTHQGLLVVLLLVAAWRAWAKQDAPERGDQRALLEYAFLVLVLSLLTTIPVPPAS
jgi:Zn-dependent protease